MLDAPGHPTRRLRTAVGDESRPRFFPRRLLRQPSRFHVCHNRVPVCVGHFGLLWEERKRLRRSCFSLVGSKALFDFESHIGRQSGEGWVFIGRSRHGRTPRAGQRAALVASRSVTQSSKTTRGKAVGGRPRAKWRFCRHESSSLGFCRHESTFLTCVTAHRVQTSPTRPDAFALKQTLCVC